MKANPKIMRDEHEQIRDFLLGHLTLEAAETFESRLFLEEDLYRQVEEAKFALADDFTAGNLTADDALRFQQLCRLSPAMQSMADDSNRLRIALASRLAPTKSSWFGFNLPVFATAFAVAILAFFLIRHYAQQRPQPQVAAVPQIALLPAIKIPATLPASVFFLADLATRGPNDVPTISIAPATTRIDLQLELKGRAAEVSAWKLELVSHGQTTPLAEAAHPQHAGAIAYLLCPTPVTALPSGRYSIRLTPLTPGSPSLTRAFLLKHTAAGESK